MLRRLKYAKTLRIIGGLAIVRLDNDNQFLKVIGLMVKVTKDRVMW